MKAFRWLTRRLSSLLQIFLLMLAVMVATTCTYDAQGQASRAYDVGVVSTTCEYDAASIRTANDDISGKPETIGAAAKCVGFVAPNGAGAKSFFEGSRYTPKVLKQMEGGVGEFHSFPESVTAFENAGKVRTITGGDKVVREVLEIPGSYSGRDGVFQFIKNPDGTINHRLFVPNQP